MNTAELEQYLDENSDVIKQFRAKCLEFQQEKNHGRQFAKRWNDAKVNRAVDKMVAQFVGSIRDNLSHAIKGKNDYKSWQLFIDENEVIEGLEESVMNLEFE
ncbi:hypothetical protein ACNAN0_05975 [Agrilactobacillus fermenti]|uniref:hypothetical protein n=1 Tax=Agrilactobacillus fermenti TaxID=2586909 RepID=UPI001E41DF23|nr:hypothetical protein [Agrilactobacillus fermenti]MCD2256195.1 hypothetical protein [Agrilactobacillus fermenti]